MHILSPMLADPADLSADALIASPLHAEEQKLDGDRVLVHVDAGRVMPVSRSGKDARSSRHLVKAFEQFAAGGNRWVFDGELLAGVYWVFDLVEAAGIIRPYFDFNDRGDDFKTRRDTLEGFFSRIDLPDCVQLVESFRDEASKRALFEKVQAEGGEGVMFKRLDSPYRCGKRTRDFCKVKFTNEVDCFVNDRNIGGKNNYQVSVYDLDGEPVIIGEVTALAGDKDRIEVGMVVTVKYLYASRDERKLIQATLPRIRHDKTSRECTIDQLVYFNKTVQRLT